MQRSLTTSRLQSSCWSNNGGPTALVPGGEACRNYDQRAACGKLTWELTTHQLSAGDPRTTVTGKAGHISEDSAVKSSP